MLFILTFTCLLFGVSPVFAGEPPVLINPANDSTVTSSALNWQASSYPLYSPNPYKVQVDDSPSFSPASSIYRDVYKSNTAYTPVLTEGTWYWRVKAKDSSGNWSEWSDAWSFVLIAATPSPSPSSSPSPTLSPTPTPTQTPTPSPTPSSTSSPSAKKSTTSSTKTPSPTSNPPTPAAAEIPPTTPPTIVKPTVKIEYRIASVAAVVATATPAVKSQKELNLIPWIGSILIIAGFSLLGYILIKNGAIYKFFRKRD